MLSLGPTSQLWEANPFADKDRPFVGGESLRRQSLPVWEANPFAERTSPCGMRTPSPKIAKVIPFAEKNATWPIVGERIPLLQSKLRLAREKHVKGG